MAEHSYFACINIVNHCVMTWLASKGLASMTMLWSLCAAFHGASLQSHGVTKDNSAARQTEQETCCSHLTYSAVLCCSCEA